MNTADIKNRKRLFGFVVSYKFENTFFVKVYTGFANPLYGRTMLTSKKYKAHDENNEARIGDRVQIVETRPLSKDKRWRLQTIVEKAPVI